MKTIITIIIIFLSSNAFSQFSLNAGIRMTVANATYTKWTIQGIAGNVISAQVDTNSVAIVGKEVVNAGGLRVSPVVGAGYSSEAVSAFLNLSGGKFSYLPEFWGYLEFKPVEAISDNISMNSELTLTLLKTIAFRLNAGTDLSYPIELGRQEYWGFGVGLSYTIDILSFDAIFYSQSNRIQNSFQVSAKYTIQ